MLRAICFLTMSGFFLAMSIPAGFCLAPSLYLEQESTARRVLATAQQRVRNGIEEDARISGTKAAWMRFLSEHAAANGYAVPESAELTIQDGWNAFIDDDYNKPIIAEIHSLIEEAQDKPLPREKIDSLLKDLHFPEAVERKITHLIKNFSGPIIVRSSGEWEDRWEQSFAGGLISPYCENPKEAAQTVKEIFLQAFKTILITQNGPAQRPGAPNRLRKDQGVGILFQPFSNFHASGTINTDGQHVTIETVFYDLAQAVRPGPGIITTFVFDKVTGELVRNYAAFDTVPLNIRFTAREKTIDDAEDIRDLLIQDNYPQINNRYSPISETQARQLFKSARGLEKAAGGTPLDIEWGYEREQLDTPILVQARPLTGQSAGSSVEKSPLLQNKPPLCTADTAIGITPAEGITAHVVIIDDFVTPEQIQQFENIFPYPYMMVKISEVAADYIAAPNNARVLIDFTSSVQGHGVTELRPKFMDGTLYFASGRDLWEKFYEIGVGPFGVDETLNEDQRYAQWKELLANKERLRWSSPMRGIRISAQKLTYFFDGRHAEFFLSDEQPFLNQSMRDNPENIMSNNLRDMSLNLLFASATKEKTADSESSSEDQSGFLNTPVVRDDAASEDSSKLHILMVEDDTDVRNTYADYMAAFLDTKNYKVDVVASMHAAVEMIQKFPPHVLISDHTCPVKISVCR
ncbi:MAG: hypothetical protein NC924_07515 [Candidatus Omnitrophica bacterium]|nr:hypothetical protein [Candidatus Omnitrophota bacterium]